MPTENAALAGLRRVIDEETVKKVLDVLRDDVSEMPKNWNRRFKHNRDKIKTGDIYELAEVVRNLSLRENEKGLSTGEKQMFTRAKKILASELMYALDKDEEEAESYLDELLADSASQPDRGAPARSSEAFAHASDADGLVPRARSPLGYGRRADRRRGQRRAPRRRPARRRSSSSAGARCCSGASTPSRAGRRSSRSSSRCPPGGVRPTGIASASTGGAVRSESVRRALAAAAGDGELVLVHDAARPLLTRRAREAMIAALKRPGVDGAIAAAPVTDTIKRVDADGLVARDARSRASLWAVQTPQVFRRAALERALDVPPRCSPGRPTTPG